MFKINSAPRSQASRVGFHQSTQNTGIQNGLREGSISASEAQHLSGQRTRISEAKSSAMADGKMDKGGVQEPEEGAAGGQPRHLHRAPQRRLAVR